MKFYPVLHLFYRHCGAVLEDLVCILLRADADTRPSADQILCIPALRPYVQNYVRRMTGEKGLPGTPRPQSCRSSLSSDSSPILTPLEPKPKQDNWNVSPEGSDNPFSPPESSGSRKRKYEPRNPSPLTYKEEGNIAPPQQSLCPILQLCVRHPNIPGFKHFLQKKGIVAALPSQTDKENVLGSEVAVQTIKGVGSKRSNLII